MVVVAAGNIQGARSSDIYDSENRMVRDASGLKVKLINKMKKHKKYDKK